MFKFALLLLFTVCIAAGAVGGLLIGAVIDYKKKKDAIATGEIVYEYPF